VLGGGMRQCGIIAAAGITALEQMVDRIAEDHANARRLAEGIARIPGLAINREGTQTNIIYFEPVDEQLTAKTLVKELGEKGIKLLQIGPSRIRAVTHYGITAEDIDLTLAALGKKMQKS